MNPKTVAAIACGEPRRRLAAGPVICERPELQEIRWVSDDSAQLPAGLWDILRPINEVTARLGSGASRHRLIGTGIGRWIIDQGLVLVLVRSAGLVSRSLGSLRALVRSERTLLPFQPGER